MEKTIYEMSNAYIEKQELETKRNGNIPDWWGGIATIACNAITDADKELKELRHFKDTTVGLYAFDKELDNIFENIPNKEGCKTSVEAYLVQQIEYLKSILFRIS